MVMEWSLVPHEGWGLRSKYRLPGRGYVKCSINCLRGSWGNPQCIIGGIQASRVLYRAPWVVEKGIMGWSICLQFPVRLLGAIHAASECQDAINLQTCLKQPSTVKLITNVFYSALPLKLGKCASYEEFGTPHLLEKGPIWKRPTTWSFKNGR